MTDPDELRDAIARHGAARRAAQRKARGELEALRELAPRALAAGISKVEFAQLAQISRVTLDGLLSS